MSNFAALPSRQVTFSRPANVAQQPYQQIQQQQAANSGLALPYSNAYLPGPSSQNNLALPVPSVTPYQTQQQAQVQQRIRLSVRKQNRLRLRTRLPLNALDERELVRGNEPRALVALAWSAVVSYPIRYAPDIIERSG